MDQSNNRADSPKETDDSCKQRKMLKQRPDPGSGSEVSHSSPEVSLIASGAKDFSFFFAPNFVISIRI